MPRSLAMIGADTMLTSATWRPDQAGKRRAGQRLGVHARSRAVIEDLDLLDRRLGHLADKGAEHLGQLDERLQLRRFLGGDRGHVDARWKPRRSSGSRTSARPPAARRFPAPRVVEAPRCGVQTTFGRPNSGLSVAGSTSNTSKPAPATLPDFMRGDQIGLDDQAAARAIDDAHAVLHLGNGRSVDDVARLVGQRHMQRDEIGPRKQRRRVRPSPRRARPPAPGTGTGHRR